MPQITENDLVHLHNQIDKEKDNNLQLLGLISKKNKSLAKKAKAIAVLSGLAIILGLGLFAMVAYATGQKNTFNSLFTEDQSKVDAQTFNELKSQNETLTAENESLTEIREYYLTRRLLETEPVYAVQVNSFSENMAIAVTSNAFSNANLLKAEGYLKFSLGVYETKAEALELKNLLVKSGIKDAFVASYKNGKRVRIEE